MGFRQVSISIYVYDVSGFCLIVADCTSCLVSVGVMTFMTTFLLCRLYWNVIYLFYLCRLFIELYADFDRMSTLKSHYPSAFMCFQSSVRNVGH